MLHYHLGKPNTVNKEVLVQFEKIGTSENGFIIEDINPNKKVGIPNTLIKVDCLYLKDDYSRINLDKFIENITIAIEGLFAFDEFSKKLNVSFVDLFKISYKNATLLFLLANKFSSQMNFYVFMEDLESRRIFDELSDAIDTIKSNKEYRMMAKNLYGKNVLTKSQECILEKTFGLVPDFSGKTLKIVDTHNLHHRNFHGMPDMRNTNDQPTAIIKGFTLFMKSILENPTDYIIFASEGGNAVRYDIFEDYKANRSETTDDLRSQIKICNELTEKMGLALVREEGFEADDIIGSYTEFFTRYGGTVEIVSSDKDMYQLISDKVKIWNQFDRKYISEEDWMKKFAVSPDKIVYSLAIQGDTSDNVPGIKGLGKVAAAKLINEFGDIEGIIKGAETLKKSVMKEKLLAGFDDLRMSYDLVRLYDFLAEEADFNQFKFPTYNCFYLIEKELAELKINL